ncbi:MAG: ATP-dependent RNA helicase RhlE [Hyphomicrobiaceae bacterium]|jgi:ATP-dependent RNA helicase RhlE
MRTAEITHFMSVSSSPATPAAPLATPLATTFTEFGLHETLLDGVRELGFESPRPIQAATIPAGMLGRDVLGLAQTGTGKTAAFALPLLNQIVYRPGKGPRALILAPTRELATQIAEEIRALSKFTRVKVITCYGGVSMRRQHNELRENPEIVVGCPGRVLDLLQQRVLRLNNVETLVLDEADHMFDMGFLPTIRKILAGLPKQRQNLLFSATMPREIRRLAEDLLTNPEVVELGDTAPASTIDHALYLVQEGRKRTLLEQILTSKACDTAIVFTRTKHRARRLAEQLNNAGHNAIGLQGNMSQGQRDRAMEGFRSRRFNILVATDIVARGIDVSDVSHVINFDVPNTPEAYTHRIGRTGRSEQEGIAYTFVTDADRAWVRATERKIGKPIPRLEATGLGPDIDEKLDRGGAPRGNYRGQRPSGPAGQGRNTSRNTPRGGGQRRRAS